MWPVRLPADDRMRVETQQLLNADGLEILVVLADVTLEIVVPGLLVALAVRLAALDVILDELDVLFIKSVRGVGMPTIGRFYDNVGISDGGHKGIFANYRIRHDALGLCHDAVRRARHPAVAEARTQMLAVAVDIRPTDMDDRPVRPQRRHGDDFFRLADRVDEFD